MKFLYFISCVLSLFFRLTKNQFVDFCSHREHLEGHQNDCLQIGGCCFAEIEMGEDESVKEDAKKSQKSFCFRKYLKDEAMTCEHYKSVTGRYGNVLNKCKCNDMF